MVLRMLNKAVFIDRDGTINFDSGYLRTPDQVKILPKVIDGLKLLKKNDFKLFIITNQSGIGRGLLTAQEAQEVNNMVLEKLGEPFFETTLICPHKPKDNCACRKPSTLLVEQAAKNYNLNLASSYTIGDKTTDKELGFNMGGYGIKLGENGVNNILDAAKLIISGAIKK